MLKRTTKNQPTAPTPTAEPPAVLDNRYIRVNTEAIDELILAVKDRTILAARDAFRTAHQKANELSVRLDELERRHAIDRHRPVTIDELKLALEGDQPRLGTVTTDELTKASRALSDARQVAAAAVDTYKRTVWGSWPVLLPYVARLRVRWGRFDKRLTALAQSFAPPHLTRTPGMAMMNALIFDAWWPLQPDDGTWMGDEPNRRPFQQWAWQQLADGSYSVVESNLIALNGTYTLQRLQMGKMGRLFLYGEDLIDLDPQDAMFLLNRTAGESEFSWPIPVAVNS